MIWFKVSCSIVLIVDLDIRDVMVSANGYLLEMSLLSYFQRYLGDCIVFCVFCVFCV